MAERIIRCRGRQQEEEGNSVTVEVSTAGNSLD